MEKRKRWLSTLVALLPVSPLMAQPTPSVTGTITDLNGAAIEGAQVTVTGPGGPQSATVTADGKYSVGGLVQGANTIRVTAPGFRPYEAQFTVSGNRIHNVAMTPAPSGDVLYTVVDAASQRPGYLPGSKLAPGASFTAYGSFSVPNAVAANSLPYPRTLNGVTANFIDAGGRTYNPRLFFVSQAQISGLMEEEASAGIGWLDFRTPTGVTNRARVRVTESWPRFFYLNQAGFGAGIFTHPNFELVTRQNPARPGQTVIGWINNFGDRPGSDADKRNGPFRFRIDIGNERGVDGNLFYFGRSGPGFGQFNVALSQDVSESCAQTARVFYSSPTIAGFLASESAIPVAQTGACGDPLGFSADDWSALSGEGIELGDLTVSEITAYTPTAEPRNIILSAYSAARWREQTYRSPPSPGQCHYRWQPQGFVDPSAPIRLQFAGNARLTTPWGAFDYSPMSNNGPYSLLFSFPGMFTQGNYSFTAGSGFMVGGQPVSFQHSGQYRRDAGQARQAIAQALRQRFGDGPLTLERLGEFLKVLLDAYASIPEEIRKGLFTDYNVQFNDGTRGAHIIRCVADGAGDQSFVPATLDAYAPSLPRIANDTLVALRFLPKERNRFDLPRAGPLDRQFVNFDAAVQFTGYNLRVRE